MIDIIAGAALVLGALMSTLAGIAVLRFPDVMSRIHAATKPQVLGIMLLMLGVGLRLQSAAVIGLLVLIVVLQFVTAPVSAHLVVRAAHQRRPSVELSEEDEPTELSAKFRPRPQAAAKKGKARPTPASAAQNPHLTAGGESELPK